MIVVIPFCAKDEALCVKNIETAIALDDCVDFHAVVSHAADINGSVVMAAANRYFQKVTEFQYPTYKGNTAFPHPHNYAWQNTARQMVIQGEPWFWWEPDSVPVRAGWLTQLEHEYEFGKKSFMGNWVTDNPHAKPYMNGVAVYPANFRAFPAMVFRVKEPSWDVAMGPFIAQEVHTANHLIQHSIQDRSFFNYHQFKKELPAKVVLVHKCKDGSLHELIIENSTLFKRVGNSVHRAVGEARRIFVRSSPVTVVITNFKRPYYVWRAFESCLQAGIANVVVSSSGTDSELEIVHERMRSKMPSVKITAIPDDKGCNEMWLRGVKSSDTPWVHILHDDDFLLPEFRKVTSYVHDDIGFVFWCGEMRDYPSNTSKGIINYLGLPEGIHDTDVVLKQLMKTGTHAISPVAGLFQRDDVVETLTECSEIEQDFLLRPNMMVGNDTLIWMRAAEKYQKFYWVPRALIGFGSWPGSTTYDDISNKKGLLLPIYERMRTYFRDHPKIPWEVPKGLDPRIYRYVPESKIIHCVEVHEETNPAYKTRRELAMKSWQQLYDQGVVPAHYTDFVRDSTQIGDTRKLVFVKDMLAFGMKRARDNDILMWTNGDNILHPRLPEALKNIMSRQPVVVSQRCGYKSQSTLKFDPGSPLFKHESNPGGRDLFAFRKWWLEDYWDKIPDYILGGPWWDLLMTLMIRNYLGVANISLFNGIYEKELPPGYVAHIDHQAEWLKLMQNGGSISNDYDTRLARHHLLSFYPDKTLAEVGL